MSSLRFVSLVSGVSSVLLEMRLISLLSLGFAELRFSIMLNLLLRRSNWFLFFIVFIFIIIVFNIFKVIIKILIFFNLFFKIFTVLVIFVFFNCNIFRGSKGCNFSGYLSFLLRRLRFLLGGCNLSNRLTMDGLNMSGEFGSGSNGQVILFLIIIRFEFTFSEGKIIVLIGLKEAGHMEGSASFNGQVNFVKERHEDIDGCMGLFLGEVGNEVFLSILLDPEGGRSVVGGGGKNDVGKGQDLSLAFVNLVRTEAVLLTLRKDFAEEHDC